MSHCFKEIKKEKIKYLRYFMYTVIWSISKKYYNPAIRVFKSSRYRCTYRILQIGFGIAQHDCVFSFPFFLDFGYCSPFDNKVDDCINGQCVVYPDQYGSYQSTCKCKDGFYGEKCDGE